MPGPEPDRDNKSHTVAELIAGWIGAAPVAGVSGANIEDLFHALWRKRGRQTILSRHESGACALADGYSRVSGRAGIVLATSGGGALNLVPGIAEAFASRIPLLAIIGQPPAHLEGSGAFQETSGLVGTFSIADTYRSCCKEVLQLRSAENAIPFLNRALRTALQHPRGPVAVLVPKSVLASPAPLSRAEPPGAGGHDRLRCEALERLAARLAGAARIGFVFGAGAAREGLGEKVRRMTAGLRARWTATVEARELGDFGDEGFLGLSGVIGHPEAAAGLAGCERVVFFGTRLGAVDRFGLEKLLQPGKTLYVNTEEAYEPAKWFAERDRILVPSLEAACDTLLARAAPAPGTAPAAAPAAKTRRTEEGLTLRDLGPGLAPLILERAINVIADAGNAVSAFALDMPRPRAPGSFLIAMGMGGMGYSFGAGLGACLANELPTLILAGDGAFAMNGSEFHVAVERRLPVCLVLADNGGHAMCTTRERLYFGVDTGTNVFSGADFASGLAALYPGVPVHYARTVGELSAAVERLRGFSAPCVLVLRLPHDETPPFQPFLTTGGKK